MSVLCGARIVTPGGILENGSVEVVDGRIAAVGPLAPGIVGTDLGGAWLVPGFIDIHMHGGGGFDVTRSAADMAAAVAFHHSQGTTRTLVSLMAQPIDAMCEQLTWVAALTGDGVIAGGHLEGPFLSVSQCGAQRPADLIAPDSVALRQLLSAGQGSVRTVTVAPELTGALELIAELVAAGVRAAIGHTGATYEQAVAGFRAGATVATHLFNGMGPFSHRAPGVAIAALNEGAFVELINDGVHVHDALTRMVARVAKDQLVLITDAISATGVGDGEYSLGHQTVVVADGAARLRDGASLAGSTLTMSQAVRRAVLSVGMSVPDAVAAASTTPARVLGLQDKCGAIARGLDADLVVLDDDLQVQQVMIGGHWL